jgi:hypothetical protein
MPLFEGRPVNCFSAFRNAPRSFVADAPGSLPKSGESDASQSAETSRKAVPGDRLFVLAFAARVTRRAGVSQSE